MPHRNGTRGPADPARQQQLRAHAATAPPPSAPAAADHLHAREPVISISGEFAAESHNSALLERRGSEFAELSRLIKRHGLLDRRKGSYAAKLLLNGGAVAGAWAVFFVLGSSWWQLGLAALLAAVYTQLAFLGHDAGHKQIFTRRRANDAAGHVLGGLVGMSFGWWVGKHNRHHANPNHEDDDPDLDIKLLAFTREQAAASRGFSRWVMRRQAWLFFPLLTLEGLSLHVSSAQAVWRGEVKFVAVEAVLFVLHVAIYLAAVFWILSPLQGIAFIAVHQGLWGIYMGCSFAPNHKGMPTLSSGQKIDYLRKQVVTSRNVRGSRIVDFALGGLNYQIEHHLFPSMARANLRRAQPIVQRFCVQRKIPYCQTSARRSYAEVLRHLNAIGASLR